MANIDVERLIIDGASEAEATQYITYNILPARNTNIQQSVQVSMKWTGNFASICDSRFRLVSPKPDFLYGYRFNHSQLRDYVLLARPGLTTTSNQIVLPFLIIAIKCEKGNMYEGDSQALGAASISLAMAAELKK